MWTYAAFAPLLDFFPDSPAEGPEQANCNAIKAPLISPSQYFVTCSNVSLDGFAFDDCPK
jgi:hypothetical protein